MKAESYSIIDLVVLGILLKTPMNAYRLAHFVEQQNVSRLVKLSSPAIYKSCKRLFAKDYLAGELTRDGEAPEKMVYKVTESGRKRFSALMAHFASKVTPFYFDFNSVVYSLEQLPYEQGLELIEAYLKEIHTMQSWLVPHSQDPIAKSTFASRMIIKQYLMVVGVLVEWTEHLRGEFVRKFGD